MNPFRASSVEILEGLRERWGDFLRPEITSVRLLHKGGLCFLEITAIKDMRFGCRDELVERIDLGFIGGREGDKFPPERSIFQNAEEFVERFDAVSIINCTSLFTDEAAEFISNSEKRWGTEA